MSCTLQGVECDKKELENSPSSEGASKGLCPLVCPAVIKINHLFYNKYSILLKAIGGHPHIKMI